MGSKQLLNCIKVEVFWEGHKKLHERFSKTFNLLKTKSLENNSSNNTSLNKSKCYSIKWLNPILWTLETILVKFAISQDISQTFNLLKIESLDNNSLNTYCFSWIPKMLLHKSDPLFEYLGFAYCELWKSLRISKHWLFHEIFPKLLIY